MMNINYKKVVLFSALLFSVNSFFAQKTFRSFEMRYITDDKKANGETDFRGKNEFLNLDQRIKFLTAYAKTATAFYNDSDLNKQPVSLDESKEILKKIKPQPLPQVRNRQFLNNWMYIGYNEQKIAREKESLKYWSQYPSISTERGTLLFKGNQKITKQFKPLDWRSKLTFRIRKNNAAESLKVTLPGVLSISIDIKGKIVSSAKANTNLLSQIDDNEWHDCLIELDFDEQSMAYNFYVDNKKNVDFLALKPDVRSVGSIEIEGSNGWEIDDLVVVRFGKKEYIELHDRDEPFSIETALNESFSITPNPNNFSNSSYSTTKWLSVDEMPFSYGGERYKDETLFLRSKIEVPESFKNGKHEKALLNIEAISPKGAVWINGQVVHFSEKPYPVLVDIAPYLKKEDENIIGIEVHPFEAKIMHRHISGDHFTGWYAGRVWIDYTSKDYLSDPYTFTQSIEGKDAIQKLHFNVNTERWLKQEREVKIYNGFVGKAEITFYEWFPIESQKAASAVTVPISVELFENKTFSIDIPIENAKLWSADNPQLYKAVIKLKDKDSNDVDDIAYTFGVRTISQEGGIFRINGKPSMMNGALVLGHRNTPIENIARWVRCAPAHVVVQDLMKIKRMNGNTIRMSHHDEQTGGTNDPRYAEYADQLGIMFQWATPSWVRSGSPWQVDFEGLPQYVKQVRNHPSIIMWQPANHPKAETFYKAVGWLEKVYYTICSQDSSRLISPTANQIRIDAPNDDGTASKGEPREPYYIWTAPLMTRGNMDFTTGYGAKWDVLRKWPESSKWEGEQGWRDNANRLSFLHSKERAYFDFECEESISQHNWNLQKGKPEYKIMSYELDADEGSIGRLLTTDEWRESQAWQAFSGYEALKKKRILGYDGFAWCELSGGGNSGTYLKPIIDYYGYAKLSFYALQSVFQPTFACSKNVDIAYGADDKIDITVIHLGEETHANVLIEIVNQKGKTVEKKEFKKVRLEGGRTVNHVATYTPNTKVPGYYSIYYTVKLY